MRYYTCDRCGATITVLDTDSVTVEGSEKGENAARFDLCPNCRRDLRDWLATERQEGVQQNTEPVKPQTYKYTTKKLAEMVKLPTRTVVRRLEIMGAAHEWVKVNGHGAFLWEVDADQIKLLDDRRGVHAPNRMKPAGKPAPNKPKGKARKERLDWWKMSDLVGFYGVNRKSVKKAIDRTEGVKVRERRDRKNPLIHWKEYGMTDATCKSIGETLRKF